MNDAFNFPDETADRPAVLTKDLSKQYGQARGIQNVNLAVAVGEIFGFLGPNGAGKTTTIRLLLDLINPTSGQVFLFGQPVERRNATLHNNVGYLPGELHLYERMTGRDLLDYLGRFQRDKPPARQEELLDALALSLDDLKRPLRFYSQGMKRKIGIIQAMQHDPRLLILDEPTEGLDPLMQQSFYQLLRDYQDRGGTVFMSSHILPEVEQVFDRVGLIRQGEIVAVQAVEELRRRRVRRLTLITAVPLDISALREPGITLHNQEGTETTLFVAGDVNLPRLLHKLAQLDLVDFSFTGARLEDFFLQYYNKGERHD
jgi:ABC-2 type transport system ATP-binding protein